MLHHVVIKIIMMSFPRAMS